MKRFVVSESSMEPTLRPGDLVVASKAKRLHRGDLVVFERSAGFYLVKRVAGCPEDRIEIVSGALIVNGSVETRWPYGPLSPDGEWPVAEGDVFVLSDNPTVTMSDSRWFGGVPAAACLRVRGRYWPGPKWFATNRT